MTTKTMFALTALTTACALTGCEAPETADAFDADTYYYGNIDGKADTAKTGRFETFTGQDGKTYFHLLATNGEKVLASQGYADLASAEEGIATIRFNGMQVDAYQLLQAVDGEWYFNLLAGNWEVVGTGELYVSKSNAERGIATVASIVEHATYGRASSGGSKFQVWKSDNDGQYYFHLRAGNGAIVLQSEGYTTKANATKGTASVLTNGSDIRKFHVKDAANGQAYFTVTAANGQVIAVSQTYASRSGAQDAANAVSAIITAMKAGN
jgi:uncharacterized protein YegP (UPF0339 family)